MTERLGVVAEHLASRRVDLFGEQAHFATKLNGFGHQFLRLVHTSGTRQRVDQPEAAGKEGTLSGLLAPAWKISIQKNPAGPKSLPHGRDRGADAVRPVRLQLRHG